MTRQVYIYGLGGADKMYRVLAYHFITEEDITINNLVYWASIAAVEMQRARDSVGASGSKTKITFTDCEWEAVQAGAISDSKLMKILNSSKSDEIIKRAMPKASTTLSSAKLGKAQAMLANGYSYAEIAKACDVPESTIYDNLNK